MQKVKVLILRTAGTNCDEETAFAFESVGAKTELVHIKEFVEKRRFLRDYRILALPGGFTYGDDIGSGKILANELKYKLKDDIVEFVESNGLIIGICNGFQVLVKAGILPGFSFEQSVTLTINDSGKFEDRWVYLSSKFKVQSSKCVWTQGISPMIYLPVAHMEGKFVVRDKGVLEELRANGQVVFQYVDEKGEAAGYPFNPNGSVDNIAGICDRTGRILGMMPHPERFFHPTEHPRWTREGLKSEGDGAAIFRNGVEWCEDMHKEHKEKNNDK